MGNSVKVDLNWRVCKVVDWLTVEFSDQLLWMWWWTSRF